MTRIASSRADPHDHTAVILVDHGSRRDASNQLLLKVVEAYRAHSQWHIVEPAHMELAEPSITTAFEKCVQRGAELVIVFPYFLSPGRHWNSDIPALAAAASAAAASADFPSSLAGAASAVASAAESCSPCVA